MNTDFIKAFNEWLARHNTWSWKLDIRISYMVIFHFSSPCSLIIGSFLNVTLLVIFYLLDLLF